MGATQTRYTHPLRRDFQNMNSKLSWTESLSSACTSSMEVSVKNKRDSLSSFFTLERLSESSAPTHGSLSLAFEEISQIQLGQISDDLLNTVHTLDASNNRLSDVQFLSEFEILTTLNLDRNRLEDTTAFPKMPKLQWLSLNYNKIFSTTPFISSLAVQCPNLRFLSLMGNEVCPNYLNGGTEQQNELYRHFVLRLFPKLIYLDDGPVTPDERLRLHTGCEHIFSSEVQGSVSSIDEGIESE